jgi:hypothetical protein
MLKIFSPEKSDGFDRERTRDLGYQRPACIQAYEFLYLPPAVTSIQSWFFLTVCVCVCARSRACVRRCNSIYVSTFVIEMEA